MRLKSGHRLMAAVLLTTLALPAAAKMPTGTVATFNEAIKSGNEALIVDAARQFGATALAHPEDPQAPVAAYEAANQLCLRGACADALPMANYLRALDTSLPVSRAEVEVLTAFASWSASAKDPVSDAAFETILTAKQDCAPSLLTIAAFEAFYEAIAPTTDWGRIVVRARLAASHLQQVRHIFPDRWATAELILATAAFNESQDFTAYDKISDLEAWLRGKRRDNTFDERLAPIHYEAMAWQFALTAFFTSYDNASVAKVNRYGRSNYQKQMDLAQERAAAITDRFERTPSNEPPLCSGEIVANASPSYPRKAARRGYIGAVVLGIDFEDGKISHVEVLAAVPDDAFEQASLDGMETFRWEFDRVQETPNCTRTKRTAMVYPLLYVMR